MKTSIKNIHSLFLKYHVYFYIGMVALVLIDLISKKVMEAILLNDSDNRITVIENFFTLSLLYNTGAFSGILGGSYLGRLILVLISLICGVIMILGFNRYYSVINNFEKYGLLFAIPGTLGNLYDRFLMIIGQQEGVIDFLEFDLGFMVWNTFNLADAFLVGGIIAFGVGYLIRESKNDKKNDNNVVDGTNE